MAFHDVLFPVDISYGASRGPGWQTRITELASGQEERVAKWSEPRMRFNAATGLQGDDQLQLLDTFARARQGSLHSFKWKDWLDYGTGADGKSVDDGADVNIGTGDGTTTTFQLVKKYTSGSQTVTRVIKLPVNGTVQVEVNSVAKTEGTDYTVNYATGVITFTAAPTNTHPVTAGFEYYVHVRFGEEVDDWLESMHVGFDSSAAQNVPVVEVLDNTNREDDFYYGGAQNLGTISADVALTSTSSGRVVSVNPNTSGLNLDLPTDPENYPTGGPIWYIINENATNTIAIIGEDGVTTIKTLGTQSACVILNGIDSGGSETWHAW